MGEPRRVRRNWGVAGMNFSEENQWDFERSRTDWRKGRWWRKVSRGRVVMVPEARVWKVFWRGVGIGLDIEMDAGVMWRRVFPMMRGWLEVGVRRIWEFFSEQSESGSR